jgi:hypothetical protein
MVSAFDPGALLARYYTLPRGPRVCLRLARPRDQACVHRLLQACGQEASQLDVARLTYFDLTERVVLCAAALIDGTERLLGVGCVELDSRENPVPTLIAVDNEVTDGLSELLGDALVGHATAILSARAA